MHQLTMALRDVDHDERLVVGVVAPYDEVTYLTPGAQGERIMRGAFTRSIQHRGDKVPLFRDHDHRDKLGTSVRFSEADDGLVGAFKVLGGPRGDDLMESFRHGYVDRFSVGFQPVAAPVGDDGVREVREARLVEVSAVALPAYEGAAVLAVRHAQDLDDLLAPFRNPPVVNLSPIPPIWGR